MNNSSVGNVQRLQEVGAGMKEPHNERNTTHKILSMVMMELHSFFFGAGEQPLEVSLHEGHTAVSYHAIQYCWKVLF